MSEKELELSIKSFKKAVKRLAELRKKRGDADILRDAMIQRFEFTYELCWKTLKIYLNDKGIICPSPKDCFKKALQNGLIDPDQEQVFLNMLKDRNLTSHVYREKTAVEVGNRIRKDYIAPFEAVLRKLEVQQASCRRTR